MIYLCSVYSLNADKALMQRRYQYAAQRTAEFLKEGHTVFCPINHCHPIAEKFDMPREWEFWEQHDLNYIDACDEVWVLQMPGFQDSTGITAEVDYALSKDKPLKFIECEDYVE